MGGGRELPRRTVARGARRLTTGALDQRADATDWVPDMASRNRPPAQDPEARKVLGLPLDVVLVTLGTIVLVTLFDAWGALGTHAESQMGLAEIAVVGVFVGVFGLRAWWRSRRATARHGALEPVDRRESRRVVLQDALTALVGVGVAVFATSRLEKKTVADVGLAVALTATMFAVALLVRWFWRRLRS
jgi:hypothetical protein